MRSGRADRTRPATADDAVASDFAQMGHAVEAVPQEQDVIEIMQVNHASFGAFLACQTQWRVVASMAGLFWQGIDYVAAKLVLEDIDAPRHAFADLRLMEAEALPILNERDN